MLTQMQYLRALALNGSQWTRASDPTFAQVWPAIRSFTGQEYGTQYTVLYTYR